MPQQIGFDLAAGNYNLFIGNANEWTTTIKLTGIIPARSSFLITSDADMNATPSATLPAADITASFELGNSGFKIALMSGLETLTVVNPFTEIDGSLKDHYIYLLGTTVANAFETTAAAQSRPQGPRRVLIPGAEVLTDSNNNFVDFKQSDFARLSGCRRRYAGR